MNTNDFADDQHLESGSLPSVYEENGYRDRDHYLECLAEDFGVRLSIVLALADILGPNEDFDGLVTSIEDDLDGNSDL